MSLIHAIHGAHFGYNLYCSQESERRAKEKEDILKFLYF